MARRSAPHRCFAAWFTLAATVLLHASTGWAQAEDPESARQPANLIVVGREPVAARWLGGDIASGFRFQTVAGEVSLAAGELVRWGWPPAPISSAEVRLADGTRLALAESWLGDPPFTLTGDVARATCDVLGEMQLERRQIAALFWNLPRDLRRRSRVEQTLRRAAETGSDRDCVLLQNGDVVTGDVLAIGNPSGDAASAREPAVTIRTELGTLSLPTARLAGLQFRASAEMSAAADWRPAPLIMMLGDGSRLAVAQCAATQSGYSIAMNSGAVVNVDRRQDVVALQGFGPLVAYLSDRQPETFQQQPVLTAAWPLVHDDAVAGGPLMVRGKLYVKGLGMHAPARAEYAVPLGAERFAATVAIDDTAAGGGSAVFRILVRRRDSQEWTQAAATGVLRGAATPEPLSVDVTSADRIALIVTTADRGDELDRAAWLDARFELAAE